MEGCTARCVRSAGGPPSGAAEDVLDGVRPGELGVVAQVQALQRRFQRAHGGLDWAAAVAVEAGAAQL